MKSFVRTRHSIHLRRYRHLRSYDTGTTFALPNGRVFFIFRLWLGCSAPRPNLTKGFLLLPSCLNFSSTALPWMYQGYLNSRTPGMYGSYNNTISLHHFDMGLHASYSSEMKWMDVGASFIYMFLRRSVLMVNPSKRSCVFCIMQVEEPTVYREVSTLMLYQAQNLSEEMLRSARCVHDRYTEEEDKSYNNLTSPESVN